MELRTIDWKNIITRALWTFLAVFLAAFLVAGESIINLIFNADWNGLATLLVATALAGASAGISALKTLTIELWITYKPRVEKWLKSKREN